MTFFIASLLVAVLAKAVLVALAARLIEKISRGPTESVLAGWFCVQAGLIACFLALSAFNALTLTAAWICIVLAIGGLMVGLRLSAPISAGGITLLLKKWSERLTLANIATASSIVALFFFLVFRAIYFYDTTDDALFYGMSRIAYWHQHRSILPYDRTAAIYLFIWAWNGELNSFSYFLLTGQDRACELGNVEVLAVLLLAVVFWFRKVGGGSTYAWPAAFLIVCLPVHLYLAMMVKGDLPAALGGIIGVAWTILAFRSDGRPTDNLWAIVALSYAAGSKITGIFIACPLIAVHGYLLVRGGLRRPMLYGAAMLAAVNLARYIVNFYQYGSPTATNEHVTFTLDHILTNVRGLLSTLFVRGLEPNLYYGLFAGFGLIGIISATIALTLGVPRVIAPITSAQRKGAFVPLLIFVASYLLFITSLPWFHWSPRYFLMWVLPLVLLPFIALGREERMSHGLSRPSAVFGIILFGWLHAYAVFRPSEMLPGNSLANAFASAFISDDLGRKLAGHHDLLVAYRRQLELAGDSQKPLKVKILSSDYSLIFPLWGDNAKNNVSFADTSDALQAAMATGSVDLAVVTPANLMPSISDENYVCESSQGMSFCRHKY